MDPKGQQLPTKENALFKRILKCYEQKQYKNGLKFAKQILQNFPNHGETQAMKGLTMNCLGRKEEAYNLVRQGLRNNLTSHVCWHVFGLLQRSDKKYDEAIKCYRNALKWDKDNLQILRDLSLLQIQMRDLEGYKETRYKLFELRPTQRASWIGYAMSFHLLKDYVSALKIIEEFRKTLQKNTYDYEYSELLLYQNMVMREAGQHEEALQHLEKYKDSICDKLTCMELRGELLLALNRPSEAEKFYRCLIDRNPENKEYYLQLEKALQLTTNEQKLEMYKKFSTEYPRAHVPRRLPLEYASGQVLEDLLKPYLHKALLKGVPPLFRDLQSLYSQSGKAETIEKLMYRYLKNLEETEKLEPEDENSEKEPACILFVLMYLAEHHTMLKDTEKALSLLQRAIEHTPTLIELYIIKGSVLKRSGDLIGAVEALTEAQTLDTADRYVNSKSASYMLAANMISPAQEMCSKFTREGVSAMENLNEMQCMWYQTDCANAYHRLGQFGNALKMCHQIDRHFTEIIEDQFDFHTYCMRKMTLRSYVQLLRLEDILRSNEFYWNAACLAIQIYLRIHDRPVTESTAEPEEDTSHMTAAELKKHRARQKKIRRDQEKKEEIKNNKKKQQEDPENPPQEELVPLKLERPADALSEALTLLRPLQELAPERLETHLMSFSIQLRRGKPLLMLQSLKRAHAVQSTSTELHTCCVQFLKYLKEEMPRQYTKPTDTPQINNNNHVLKNGEKPPTVSSKNKKNKKKSNAAAEAQTKVDEEKSLFEEQESQLMEVIEGEMKNIVTTMDPHQLNEEFLNRNKDSLAHRLQASRSMLFLDSVQKDRAIDIATNVSAEISGRDLEGLSSVLRWLKSIECEAPAEAVTHYMSDCHSLFPRAQVFMTTDPQGHSTTVTTTTAGSCAAVTTTSSSLSEEAVTSDGSLYINHNNHVSS